MKMGTAGKKMAGTLLLAAALLTAMALPVSGTKDTAGNPDSAEAATESAAVMPEDTDGTVLTGINLEIYTQIKEMLMETAQGSRTSTVFSVEITLPYGEYGTDSYDGTGMVEEIKEDTDPGLIRLCLQYGCPYGLWWYNSGRTVSAWSCTETEGSATAVLTWAWSVKEEYADGTYVISGEAAGEAASAWKNAEAIAGKYTGLSDAEKITAYADEICSLAHYDAGSAGNPRNFISVFDGDASTNVVCTGYAKAMKLLCDMGGLQDMECYYVTGTTAGGAGHAWNIIHTEDGNFLADLTAYAHGTDALMLSPAGGTWPGYTFSAISASGTSRSFTLTYDSPVLRALPEDVLRLD